MTDSFNWPQFLPLFNAAAESAGFVKTTLVETEAGPVCAWERQADGPRIYLSAGMHGDEPAGPLALLEMMRTNFFSDNIDWAICPALNPTGLAKNQRENASGRDMNRDYLQRSCPETAAHVEWLEQARKPDLFLSLHEDWESDGFYFYEINLGKDVPERARHILQAVERWFLPEASRIIDDHIPRERGWIFHEANPDVPEGWPEAIYIAKQGCPLSFTFETPSKHRLEDRVAAHIAASKTAIDQMHTNQA